MESQEVAGSFSDENAVLVSFAEDVTSFLYSNTTGCVIYRLVKLVLLSLACQWQVFLR